MRSLVQFLFRGRRLLAAAPPADEPAWRRHRREVAWRFLRGNGVEVGALHSPLAVPPGVRVTYVDRMPVDELRGQYPELADKPLTRVDVVDDGEALGQFAPDSQDFVIANHFLEHAQDPIGTLQSHLRVLKPGGVLYLAVPNRHFTFDVDRPPTPWEHLVRDHAEGPAWSYEGHLREWAALVDHQSGEALEAHVARLRRINYSIHFHVWNAAEFRTIIDNARAQFGLPAVVDYFGAVEFEIVCILRKTAAADQALSDEKAA